MEFSALPVQSGSCGSHMEDASSASAPLPTSANQHTRQLSLSSQSTRSSHDDSLSSSSFELPAPVHSIVQSRHSKICSMPSTSSQDGRQSHSQSPTLSSSDTHPQDSGSLSLSNRLSTLSEPSSARLPGLAEFYPHELWRQRSRAETSSSNASNTSPPGLGMSNSSSSSSGFDFNQNFLSKSKPQLSRSQSFKSHTTHSIASLMSPAVNSPSTTQHSSSSSAVIPAARLQVTEFPSSRKAGKTQVSNACVNCKRSHLACDVSRPCRRCVNLGKTHTCVDVEPKRRGRPPLKSREDAVAAAPTSSGQSELQFNFPRTAPINASVDPSTSHLGWRPSFGVVGSFHSPSLSSSSGEDLALQPFMPAGGQSFLGSRRRSVSAAAAMQLHSAHGMPSAPPLSQRHEPVVTIIAGTDMRIGRSSDETHALLGTYPIELQNRSLFDLVHAQDRGALEVLLFSLIKPVNIPPQPIPAHMNVVHNTPPARLLLPAAGTIFVHDNLRVRMHNGSFESCSVRLHLGGGFGAELFRNETLGSAYIVASVHRLVERGDLHPEPSVLRTARFSPTQDPRVFSTPAKHHYHRRDHSGSSSTSSHVTHGHAHKDSGTSCLSPALSALRWNNTDGKRSETSPEHSPSQQHRRSPPLKRGFPLPELAFDPRGDAVRPHKMPALNHRAIEPLPRMAQGETSPADRC